MRIILTRVEFKKSRPQGVNSESFVSTLHVCDMHKLKRNNSMTGVLTSCPSFLLCTHATPTPRSSSEELFPAQQHVDVYNGDGWWLALPRRATDGLLPKRLSASLHQSPSDSAPTPPVEQTEPRLNISLFRCVFAVRLY